MPTDVRNRCIDPNDPPVPLTRRSRQQGDRDISASDGELTGSVSDGWRLIGRQMWAQRVGIAAGALAGLVWTAAKVSVPKLVELAIDRGMVAGDRTWLGV